MRSIPVDDRRMELVVAVPPRQQKEANKVTGEVMWDVDLFVVSDERPDVLRVQVPESGLAKTLTPNTKVEASGLTAFTWEKDNRHGLMFRCESLRLAGSSAASGASKQAA